MEFRKLLPMTDDHSGGTGLRTKYTTVIAVGNLYTYFGLCRYINEEMLEITGSLNKIIRSNPWLFTDK